MKLFVADFDDTLFRSAYPPDGWDESIYWWKRPESLGPPCVPEVPGPEWWNNYAVQKAAKRIQDPEWYCVCLTGRRIFQANFRYRVPELLEQQGLQFNEVHLCPEKGGDESATGPWKLSVIQQLAQKLDVDLIECWDDRADHLAEWEAVLSERYSVNTHHVQEPKMKCKGFRFRGSQYVEAAGSRVLYHIGPRPPKPELRRWSREPFRDLKQEEQPGYLRDWLPERTGPVVFLTPDYKAVAIEHGMAGNVYAYRVPEWVIQQAGGIHRFEAAPEILIPESLWRHVKFLGKKMDRDDLDETANQEILRRETKNSRK